MHLQLAKALEGRGYTVLAAVRSSKGGIGSCKVVEGKLPALDCAWPSPKVIPQPQDHVIALPEPVQLLASLLVVVPGGSLLGENKRAAANIKIPFNVVIAIAQPAI